FRESRSPGDPTLLREAAASTGSQRAYPADPGCRARADERPATAHLERDSRTAESALSCLEGFPGRSGFAALTSAAPCSAIAFRAARSPPWGCPRQAILSAPPTPLCGEAEEPEAQERERSGLRDHVGLDLDPQSRRTTSQQSGHVLKVAGLRND